MRYLALIAALLLGACGSGTHDGAMQPAAATPPVALADTFFAAVLFLAGDSSDSAEPVAPDAGAATAPEDSEPAALK